MNKWEHPNPIFLDFETQSICDIQETGGRYYAEHPSTRILILACFIDDCFHVWIPEYIKTPVNSNVLWPNKLKPEQPVKMYRDKEIPISLRECILSRPVIAHNAFGFDSLIFRRCIGGKDPIWLDSIYLARASGQPGGLDLLSQRILGEGKDHAKKLMPKLCTATISPYGDYAYPTILQGDLEAFTRYAVADVELLRRIWQTFDSIKVEADVIDVHNIINERGIEIDQVLLRQIERISKYSVREAIDEITRITKGALNESNLRSVKQVHEWLDRWGVSITDDNGKPCLRREVVQRYIDSPYLIESNLSAATEIPPIVIDVLQLRMRALRITDAKIKRAKERVSSDGRARDLISYYVAGTGRFSSQGIQIHNLPRPDKRVDIEKIINILNTQHLERNDQKLFESIKATLPPTKEHEKLLTVDDVCSALLRPIFRAKKGHKFCIADYSQVEARGIAWIADEERSLSSFRSGVDPYKQFSATIFNCSIDNVSSTQRQIAKNAVLGLGYGMGPNKFRIYCALNGADLVEAGITAEYVVEKYRNTYTKICGWKPKGEAGNFRVGGVWKALDKAVKECVYNRMETYAGKCTFRMQDNTMILTLPSTREIWYNNARIEDVIPPYVYTLNLPPIPKATVVYQSNRGTKSLFGGLIAENIVQGMCRDFLAISLVRMEEENLNPVLHVHDEPITENEDSKAEECLIRMIQIMSDVPDWAEGFPMDCKGYVAPRFVKEPFKDAFQFGTSNLDSIKVAG
jgi:DNA polymerase bacteriophage-type